MSEMKTKVKRALVSVSDKTGLAEFAKGLHELGIEIISTGGTAAAVKKAGVPVTLIEEITQFPEMLSGRVKTLHPKIHAGILARRNLKGDMAALESQGIKPIDLVVVNLYPFAETISKENVSLDDAVENIDIGGPSMLRAAAKNYKFVGIVTSPAQYSAVLDELNKNNGSLSLETRKTLAQKTFELTAYYDSLVNDYLHAQFAGQEIFPDKISLGFEKVMGTRYGENPHQKGAFYRKHLVREPCISSAEQLHGKELSYNNIHDANGAVECLKEFQNPAAVVVKHANPCGCAVSSGIADAFEKALECDPKSAFGGIIALNRECNLKTAKKITSFFNEIVIAPSYATDALAELKGRKNLRILKIIGLDKKTAYAAADFDAKKVVGGLLVQERDLSVEKDSGLKIVSKTKPSKQQLDDLKFAIKVAKHVKSNAIVLAKNRATVGIGAGQMSRIDATELAVKKAAGREKDAVLASDAFFPFRDNVDIAAKVGISAIIQPGGSIKDREVIAAADEHKLPLVFTGIRHFRH